MGGATGLLDVSVVTGLTGVLEVTGAEEKVPGKDGEGELSMLEDFVTGIGIELEETISLSVVTGLAGVLDLLAIGDRVLASDSEE